MLPPRARRIAWPPRQQRDVNLGRRIPRSFAIDDIDRADKSRPNRATRPIRYCCRAHIVARKRSCAVGCAIKATDHSARFGIELRHTNVGTKGDCGMPVVRRYSFRHAQIG